MTPTPPPGVTLVISAKDIRKRTEGIETQAERELAVRQYFAEAIGCNVEDLEVTELEAGVGYNVKTLPGVSIGRKLGEATNLDILPGPSAVKVFSSPGFMREPRPFIGDAVGHSAGSKEAAIVAAAAAAAASKLSPPVERNRKARRAAEAKARGKSRGPQRRQRYA